MQGMVTVFPAYGRDYSTAEAAMKDFCAGKDFEYTDVRYPGGRYCSIRDFAQGAVAKIRYAKLTKFVLSEVMAPLTPGREELRAKEEKKERK